MELGVEAQALWLLIIASAVAMFTKYIRLPYTIALVVVGIIMGALDLLPQMLLTPELVFHIFLPILLFEAAFNIDLQNATAGKVSAAGCRNIARSRAFDPFGIESEVSGRLRRDRRIDLRPASG